MPNETSTAIAKAADPTAQLVQQIETRLRPELAKVLPADIPIETFERIVQTAVIRNPDLLTADRPSLFTACVEAAEDGLKPDGKEGALVIYNMKVKEGGVEKWKKIVRWMPMVHGIHKKVRQSGEVATLSADIVYESDEFSFQRGDEERLFHRPNVFSQDRGMPIGAYAIATLKDGNREREVMSTAEVEQVRQVSKSKDKGPWADWWGEMAKKSVIRRLAKRLPMSAEALKTVQREDDLYDFGRAPADAPALGPAPPRPTRQAYRQIQPPDLDGEYGAITTGQMPDTPEERGEVEEETAAEEGAQDGQEKPAGAHKEPELPGTGQKEKATQRQAARPTQETSLGGGEATNSGGNGFVDEMMAKFGRTRSLKNLETEWAEAGPEINELSDADYDRLNLAYEARKQELRG